MSSFPLCLHLYTHPGICQFRTDPLSHHSHLFHCSFIPLLLSACSKALPIPPSISSLPFGISPVPSIALTRFLSLSPTLPRSLSLTRPQRIPRTARVSPESCQDMFGCQRDAERERIRYWPWCVPDKKQAN